MGKSLKDEARKMAEKREHLRTMPFETMSPAQTVMREEMGRGVHQPQHVGEVLDGVFGAPASEVTDIAIHVINTGQPLTLSFTQWITVQALIEEGIRLGYARGIEDSAPDRG